jgi:hypothetical protein
MTMKPGLRVLGAALAGVLSCSWAAGAAWTLPPGSQREAVARGASLHGAPADILYYEAPLEVPAMIAHLSKHHPGLRDLAVLPGIAVLSGAQGACTRVATVAGLGKGRSAGSLSRVCWGQAQAASPPDWLPEGGHRVFEFSEREGGFSRQVWRYAQGAGSIQPRLRQGLARQGWTPVLEPAGDAARQEWRRGGQRLAFDLLPVEQGCALALSIHNMDIKERAR